MEELRVNDHRTRILTAYSVHKYYHSCVMDISHRGVSGSLVPSNSSTCCELSSKTDQNQTVPKRRALPSISRCHGVQHQPHQGEQGGRSEEVFGIQGRRLL